MQREFADRSVIRMGAPEERQRRNLLLPAEPLEGLPPQHEILLEVLGLVVGFLGMAAVASLLLLVAGPAAP